MEPAKVRKWRYFSLAVICFTAFILALSISIVMTSAKPYLDLLSFIIYFYFIIFGYQFHFNIFVIPIPDGSRSRHRVSRTVHRVPAAGPALFQPADGFPGQSTGIDPNSGYNFDAHHGRRLHFLRLHLGLTRTQEMVPLCSSIRHRSR
jgi:hypothetical protein